MKAIINTVNTVVAIDFIKVISVSNGLNFYDISGNRVYKIYTDNISESTALKNYVMGKIVSEGESKTIYINVQSII